MTRTLAHASALALVALTAACRTTPEPEPVYIPPPEVKTCFEETELNLVTVPAEMGTRTAITEIANPPYEPIQRREEVTFVKREAYTEFRDNAGNLVTPDMLCASDLVSEPVSGEGAMLPQGGRDLTR